MPRPFLTAEWRNLLMANYVIDPALLQPFVPCHTELDSFEGACYVSLVGFLFKDTRIYGLPVPGHRTFEEVNLRFYVRYREAGKWKRGVVFVKELVPKRMIALVANTLYGEKYVSLPMSHNWETAKNELKVAYHWKAADGWNFLKAVAEREPTPLTEGSAEAFITEHYWGYTFIDEACTGVYEVTHPQWRIHRVREYDIRCSVLPLYGPAFAGALQAPPRSVFLAEGSPISVMSRSRLRLNRKGF